MPLSKSFQNKSAQPHAISANVPARRYVAGRILHPPSLRAPRVVSRRMAVLRSLVWIMLLSVACRPRAACVYEISDHFRGWVRIDLGVESCPTLGVSPRIVRVPSSGRVCTSSLLERGWAIDEFYFVGRERTRIYEDAPPEERLIWGRSVGSEARSGQTPSHFMQFFVGTKEEVAKAGEGPS